MTCLRLILFALALLPAASGRAQVRLGGFAEYDNLTYLQRPQAHQINGRNQFILQGELRHQAGNTADLFGAVELRYDETDPTRNRVYLDEAYVNLYLGDVDVRLGKQVYAWGRADGFNPTNNLAAWDFTDVLDTEDEQLGLVSARAVYYRGAWALEGVLAPDFAPSTLPGPHARWWPELPAAVDNPLYPAAGPPRLQVRYTFAEADRPDEGLTALQYALRLSGTVRGWDVSTSWFDGFDDLPALHLTPSPDLASGATDVRVMPVYHRRRVVGADFATTVGGAGLHGEAAYYLTDDWDGTDPAVDDPYLHYVVGGDYTLDDLWRAYDLGSAHETEKIAR